MYSIYDTQTHTRAVLVSFLRTDYTWIKQQTARVVPYWEQKATRSAVRNCTIIKIVCTNRQTDRRTFFIIVSDPKQTDAFHRRRAKASYKNRKRKFFRRKIRDSFVWIRRLCSIYIENEKKNIHHFEY